MTCTCASEKSECDNTCLPAVVPRSLDFNTDPAWIKHIRRYEQIIRSMSVKFCAADEDMREDCMQEARIGLLTRRIEQIKGYEEWKAGTITDSAWKHRVDRYCGNVIRNSILSYLDSYQTGNWYIGRTRHVKDRATGLSKKVSVSPRFTSLDEMVDVYGAQVDEEGQMSWPAVSEDGLPNRKGREE